MLTHEIARTLEKKFGVGEFPMVRRRLYTRVQRVCERAPDEALRIVADAVQQAESLKDRFTGGPATQLSKGKWLTKVVVIRLTEAGYWDQTPPPAEPPPADVTPASPPPPPDPLPTPAPPAPRAQAEIVEELKRRVATPLDAADQARKEEERKARLADYWQRVKSMDHTRHMRKGGDS